MQNKFLHMLKTGWTLLRLIAVVSSSIVTIISSLLPLYLHTSFTTGYLLLYFIFLSLAAITVHGGLTHLFNDYTDHLSETDARSPAILSGGSRIIQKAFISPENVFRLGKWLSIVLLTVAVVLGILGHFKLTVLILVGVWAAVSYSLPPLQLSYRPSLGEWLSLFPAMFFLGLAGPWLILDTIPLWAYQNAIINALICMAWVMVHHIPDLLSDQSATPVKRTSVVWCVSHFGMAFAKAPAMIYFTIAATFSLWTLAERLWSGLFVIVLLLVAMFLVYKIRPQNVQGVSTIEKVLLLLAIIMGVVLGIF